MRIISLFALLFCLPVYPFQKKLSFSDFYSEMIKNNLDYKNSFTDIEIAEESKASLNSLYIPSLTMSFNKDRQLNPGGVGDSESFSKNLSLTGSIPQMGVVYSTTLYSDVETIKPKPSTHFGSYDYSIGVNLLKGFGPLVGNIPFKKGDIALSQAKIVRLKAIYGSVLNLFSSYMQTYVGSKNLVVTKESKLESDKDLIKYNNLFKAGKIPKLSLLAIESQNKQLLSQELEMKKSLNESLMGLYTFVGLSKENLEFNNNVALEPIPFNIFDDAIVESLLNKPLDFETLKNPDWLLGKMALETEMLNVKQANNNVLPDVSLTYASRGSDSDTSPSTLFPNKARGNSIALNLSMPLGFVQERHDLSISNLNLEKTKRSLVYLKNSLSRTWTSYIDNYRLLKNQVEIARLLVKSSEERYKVSLPTATMGATYQQNIIAYQNDLISSKMNLNQYEMQLLLAKFNILAFHAHQHLLKSFSKFNK